MSSNKDSRSTASTQLSSYLTNKLGKAHSPYAFTPRLLKSPSFGPSTLQKPGQRDRLRTALHLKKSSEGGRPDLSPRSPPLSQRGSPLTAKAIELKGRPLMLPSTKRGNSHSDLVQQLPSRRSLAINSSPKLPTPLLGEGTAKLLPPSLSAKARNPFEYAKRDKPSAFVIEKVEEDSVLEEDTTVMALLKSLDAL